MSAARLFPHLPDLHTTTSYICATHTQSIHPTTNTATATTTTPLSVSKYLVAPELRAKLPPPSPIRPCHLPELTAIMDPSTDNVTTSSATTTAAPTPPQAPSSPFLPPSAAKAACVDPLTRTSPVVNSPSPSPAPIPPARKPQLGFSLASSSAAFALSPIPAQPTHESSAFSLASESPSVPPLQGFASAAQILQKQREPEKRGIADFSSGGSDDEPSSFFQTANQGRKRQQVQEQQLGPAKAARGASDLQGHNHAFEVTVIGLQYYEAAAGLLSSSSRFVLLREPENEHDESAIAVFLLPEREDDEAGSEVKVGYVKRKQAFRLAELLDEPDDDALLLAFNTEICAFARCIRVLDVQVLAGLGGGNGELGPDEGRETMDAYEVDEKECHDGQAMPSTIPKALKLLVRVCVSDRRLDVWHALQQAFPSSLMSAQDVQDEQETRRAQEEERIARAQQARNLQALENVMSSSSQGLRVLSLFDGIGAALVALQKEGTRIAVYCSSEVDPDALAVTDARFGAGGGSVDADNTCAFPFLNLGDIHLIDRRFLERLQPDLLIGGSPCQDLSRLNIQGKGLQGLRSGLFFEFLRIKELCCEISPHCAFVLENVVPRLEASLLEMNHRVGVNPLRLNASEVSAAARDRYYWTNLPIMRLVPTAEEATLQDVLVSGRAAEHLDNNLTSDGKARCIIRSVHRNWNLVDDPTHPASQGQRYRRLLPVEEERLMGFDDGYTDVAGALSDDQRHALLGNSFSVPVIRQLLRRLKPLGDATTADARGKAQVELRLLPLGSRAAREWCSNCNSRKCICY